MALFEEKDRTRRTPRRAGEPCFDFYDSSGRNPYIVYRDLVNGWIEEFPSGEQFDLVSRMKNRNDAQYEQALAEVVTYVALKRLGHEVEIHPVCPHPTNRPDFLVRSGSGEALAFIEVTSFGPDVRTVARDNREAAIYNGLETVNLPPGWLLGYEVRTHGQSAPSVAKLKSEIEQWARSECGDDPRVSPRRTFAAQDWEFDLTLLGGFNKEKTYERKIGAAMTGLRSVSPHLDLRVALENKARKYGIQDTPYLIVVADCKGSIPVGDHVEDALIDGLFGSPSVRFRRLADGSMETYDDRTADGFWGRYGDARNTNVSAVALLPEPNLWKLRDERWHPIIAYNPFAANPLPRVVLPLPGFGPLDNNGEYGRIEGSLLADLIGLPGEWPPEDE
ncbi:hypothetical protein AMC90_CH01794 [Rhizobium phaseoli]|uniref:hypothetical protein n=1 Tax=Rhizobium phaseoli TaxID=396 RepID=UPI0007EB6328|nr:hypothetical protein [Rhizobium phaseoli]ANL27632.1 hypothetical protein AMC90_CH01794 [Rhizobium phaseoli]